MDFSYPLIYTGPKPIKRVEVPGRHEAIVFQQGPLSEQLGGHAYADVDERDGRYLVKRFPDLFTWPEGTQLGPQFVTREEYDELANRVAALEVQLGLQQQTHEEVAKARQKEKDEKFAEYRLAEAKAKTKATKTEVKPDDAAV